MEALSLLLFGSISFDFIVPLFVVLREVISIPSSLTKVVELFIVDFRFWSDLEGA